MSIHAVPADLDLGKAHRLLRRFLREPSGVVYGASTFGPPAAVEFTPDLSAQEQTALAAILDACRERESLGALTSATDIRARFAAHALKGKTPAQIYQLMQGRVDGWSNLAAARQDLRDWLPLLAAALAWLVVERE